MRLSRLRFFIPLLLFVILILSLADRLKKGDTAIISPLEGKPFPRFTLETIFTSNEKLPQLTENTFINHFTLLVVWSSWCINCLEEQAVLNGLKQNTDLQLIGLNYQDTKKHAQAWLKKHGNPYQAIIYDPKGALSMDLGVYGVPESFLIDKNGIIIKKIVGPLKQSDWLEVIKPLIS